jgi:hypothetical protein
MPAVLEAIRKITATEALQQFGLGPKSWAALQAPDETAFARAVADPKAPRAFVILLEGRHDLPDFQDGDCSGVATPGT